MVKSADDHAIVGNGEGVIEKLVHSDGATSEVDSLAVASQLKRELLELDGVVIANHALVTNGQEHGEVLQMDGRKALSGCAGLTVKRRLNEGMKIFSRYWFASSMEQMSAARSSCGSRP